MGWIDWYDKVYEHAVKLKRRPILASFTYFEMALLATCIGLSVWGIALRARTESGKLRTVRVQRGEHALVLPTPSPAAVMLPAPTPTVSPAPTAVSSPAPLATASPTLLPARININSATARELERLPGIGPVRAQAILEYRSRVGRFFSIRQLRNVSGIGEKTLLGLEPLVCLEPPRVGGGD